jgi:hypothetical protein
LKTLRESFTLATEGQVNLRFWLSWLLPLRRLRRRRRVARLHARIEQEQRSIDALEAATSHAEIDAILKLREALRKRRRVLAAAGIVALGGAAGASALVVSRHGGAAAAAPPVQADPRSHTPAPKCPAVTLAPPRDRRVDSTRPLRFEDGGTYSSQWFSMYHPPGFSQGPAYTQHYELVAERVPHARIRVGFRWDAESGDAHFYLAAAMRALSDTDGFQDLGYRATIVGCLYGIRWDYVRTVDGERVEAERYFFVATSPRYHHTAYDLLFEAPMRTWYRWEPVWTYVKRTFRVDPHVAGTRRPYQP